MVSDEDLFTLSYDTDDDDGSFVELTQFPDVVPDDPQEAAEWLYAADPLMNDFARFLGK